MSPSLNQQIPHLYGSCPQVRDLELCVYFGAVEKMCCRPPLQREHNGDGCLSSSVLFQYESSRGHCLFRVGPRYDGLLWGVLFRSDVQWVVWVLWLCCVVGCWGMCWLWWCECVSSLSFIFCVVYGVGVCVNVCGIVCVWVLFIVWWCSVVGGWGGVLFVLSVMRVVGGVPLWVVCVFRRVDGVCWCLMYTQLLFWVRCLVLYVVCLCFCLMLVVTIWWKRTRVWVLLWLCMLWVSFNFVSPMFLMWVLWVSVLYCVLLLLYLYVFVLCAFGVESQS